MSQNEIMYSLPDDEIVDKSKFTRQRRWIENAHIDMPQDISDSVGESNIPAEPLKTVIAFLVMVSNFSLKFGVLKSLG